MCNDRNKYFSNCLLLLLSKPIKYTRTYKGGIGWDERWAKFHFSESGWDDTTLYFFCRKVFLLRNGFFNMASYGRKNRKMALTHLGSGDVNTKPIKLTFWFLHRRLLSNLQIAGLPCLLTQPLTMNF